MPDDTQKTAKELWFEKGNGKPERYFEGFELLSDDSIKTAAKKALDFENGSPSYYAEGVEMLFCDIISITKSIKL